MDFLDAIKLNLFASEIFVFTPKGEIKTMPAGCTALDFAFQIHTFLGSHCIGAKVNHKLVPLSHKLESGDQVEILTSNSQHVEPSWVNFVSTAKAKGKIQAILRRDNRESQKEGERILTEFLARHDMEVTTSALDKLCDLHEVRRHEDLFLAIGLKNIILGDKDIDEIYGRRSKDEDLKSKSWLRYVPFVGKKKEERKEDREERNYFIIDKDFNRKKPVIITDDNLNQFIFPNCCHPIPGDDILGFIDGRNRVVIHQRNCSVASKLKSTYGKRILDAKWDMHKRLFFDATIQISGIDRIGLLNQVTQVISGQLNVNIHHIDITCGEGIFNGKIELRIHDREDVNTIISLLKDIDGLQEINQLI